MPKFFIMLSSPFVENDAMFYPHVYGPFENDIEIQTEMAKRWPNDKEAKFLVIEGRVCGSPPNPREKPESEKRDPGNEDNWTRIDPNTWHCKDCGAVIMAARVAHPIHDGPFPLSGSGQCEYEVIGYCPNCEKKPSFHGTPITVQ